MKFGFRTPSLKKRIAARTSWKRNEYLKSMQYNPSSPLLTPQKETPC